MTNKERIEKYLYDIPIDDLVAINNRYCDNIYAQDRKIFPNTEDGKKAALSYLSPNEVFYLDTKKYSSDDHWVSVSPVAITSFMTSDIVPHIEIDSIAEYIDSAKVTLGYDGLVRFVKTKSERIQDIIRKSDAEDQIEMYNNVVDNTGQVGDKRHTIYEYNGYNINDVVGYKYSPYEWLELGGSIAAEAIARDLGGSEPEYFMLDEDGYVNIYWDADEAVEKLVSLAYEDMADYAIETDCDLGSVDIMEILDEPDYEEPELKKFDVVITQTETVSITVEVEAQDEDEALDIANEKYLDGEYSADIAEELCLNAGDTDYSMKVTAQ